MELRYLQKHDREVVADDERARRERQLEARWPGKKPRTGSEPLASPDLRTPDLRRIRAALGALAINRGEAFTVQMNQ